MPIDLRKFFRGLRRALTALWLALRSEQNFRIQAILAVGVLVVAWWLKITALEFAVVSVAISLVLGLELINSALERLVDMAEPRIHHYAAEIKNLMAGAVLVSAVAAAAVVALVFVPYLASR